MPLLYLIFCTFYRGKVREFSRRHVDDDPWSHWLNCDLSISDDLYLWTLNLSRYKSSVDTNYVSNSCSADSSDINGRFHTRGRTNRLVGQIVSDEQIIWCTNGTNKFFDEQTIWYLAVWKDDFSKTIYPSRRTSRRQYDINSHQMDKCQTICPFRRFVRPLVWKRPMLPHVNMSTCHHYSVLILRFL